MHGLPFLPLLLFALTYAGLALGGVPWLKLNLTGFSGLSAAAMLLG